MSEGDRNSQSDFRREYEQRMLAVVAGFEAGLSEPEAGVTAVRARAAAVDALIEGVWEGIGGAGSGVAVMAIGGYGRRELFPFSDVDLLVVHDARRAEAGFKEPVRELNQRLWDAGLRVAPTTRTLAGCERLDAENLEFTLALLDARALVGDAGVAGRLVERSVPKVVERERKKITARLAELTRIRQHRYGDTLFHLEPNVKECPGGLRDAHLVGWLARLHEGGSASAPEFMAARRFLVLVRTFLHLRHGRDDNTLDWIAQDEAAAGSLGLSRAGGAGAVDAAYWMRRYFLHARVLDRAGAQALEAAVPVKTTRLPTMASLRQVRQAAHPAFMVEGNRVQLNALPKPAKDPAAAPEVMFALFAAVAETGARLAPETESRLERALPALAERLDDGPRLWNALRPVLTGRHAGLALRAMHMLGLLELVVPEFHAIDTLVIRDAYHRYTVDEHTFVLIDTLHALTGAPVAAKGGLEPWRSRFAALLGDLPHADLLYLAALLHDTGKGHSATGHAAASERLAASVVGRLDLDAYESGLVLNLIRNHLEMSAALRRDIFDSETVRAFAARVATPEALRMLTLFTYADISAVHPDALTPWKAENLHRLYAATAQYLDRNLDDERLTAAALTAPSETMHRLRALLPGRDAELDGFLDGLPQRYLLTRSPEQIRLHVELAARLDAEGAPMHFRYSETVSELTLVTRDRAGLFADMAGLLAAWGMNIVTADAFSNAHGLVVDSFRFTDRFRTLELNPDERVRFSEAAADVLAGRVSAESLLSGRRRRGGKAPLVRIATRISFDERASTHSTLMEVVAQDTPGLLRVLAVALAGAGCNIEVALVDTEGEMAIDVFYLTQGGQRLDEGAQEALRRSLTEAMEENVR